MLGLLLAIDHVQIFQTGSSIEQHHGIVWAKEGAGRHVLDVDLDADIFKVLLNDLLVRLAPWFAAGR